MIILIFNVRDDICGVINFAAEGLLH